MIVCHCAAVNDHQLRQLIAEGAVDPLAIASACGAGSFCGGCMPIVASLLSEQTGTPPETFLDAAPTASAERRPARFRKPAEAVVRELLEDIVEQGWRVGRRLGDARELGARYGVTRGTIRDAVHLLVHHGLLVDEHEALVVGAPSPSTIGEAAAIHLHHVGVSFREVVVTRQCLEEVIAHQAALSGDSRAKARLGRHTRSSAGQQLRDHADFHLALTELTGNPAFRLLIDALIRLARDLVPPEAEQRSHQVKAADHEIAEAVLAGDPERAQALMSAHLDALNEFAPRAGKPRVEVAAHRRAHEGELPAAGLARAIAFDIRAGGAKPGDLLGSVRDLAQRYDVTRQELRRAASLLELYSVAYPSAGPDGGLVVASPDMWAVAQLMARYLDFAQIELHQIAEVLYPLELRAVELASDRLTPDDAERLQRRLEEEAVAHGGPVAEPRDFHNVHPLIAELSGNRVLALFTSALILTFVRRVREDAGAGQVVQARQAGATHADIVTAIVAGDRDLARRRMVEHLDRHLRTHAPEVARE